MLSGVRKQAHPYDSGHDYINPIRKYLTNRTYEYAYILPMTFPRNSRENGAEQDAEQPMHLPQGFALPVAYPRNLEYYYGCLLRSQMVVEVGCERCCSLKTKFLFDFSDLCTSPLLI